MRTNTGESMTVLSIIKKYLGADMDKIVKFLICNLIIFNLGIVFAIGRQDVVGYTTYDWQMGGPMSTRCRTDSVCNGIHVCWVVSNFNPGADRNLGYNYYDFNTRQWNWPATGMNIYTQRSGFGNLDYDPITGVAVAITTQITGLVAAKDTAPGAGIFSYCVGPTGYSDAVISVSNNQAIHCAMVNTMYNDSVFYARVQPWCSWSTPINICGSAPQPGNHTQAIAASKISNKVLIVWQCLDDPYPQRAFYHISNDGGINWQPTVQLPYPPVQGMTFTISSLFTMFDNLDNFHIVASLSDTGVTVPAAIWHFCPINNPQWNLIYHYAPETLAAPIGFNALHATRPSIVQSPITNNYLYVSWEQFDSLNYEPTTGLARADIWIAESPNNGLTWQNQQRITIPNTTSKRYPCVGGVFADTLVVSYLIDSIAGGESFSQGRTTRNPVVCHFILRPYAGIEQDIGYLKLGIGNLSASPNPFSSQTTIHYSLTANINATLEIYDITGRLVKSFSNNQQLKTNNSFIWNGKDNNGNQVKSGIYFCSLRTPHKTLTYKLLKTQ
jgi:hypothetical protein